MEGALTSCWPSMPEIVRLPVSVWKFTAIAFLLVSFGFTLPKKKRSHCPTVNNIRNYIVSKDSIVSDKYCQYNGFLPNLIFAGKIRLTPPKHIRVTSLLTLSVDSTLLHAYTSGYVDL